MVAQKIRSQNSDDSPIPEKKKRQSINSSGVWEVETLGTPLKVPQEQKEKNFKSFPQLGKAGNMKYMPYQPRSPIQHALSPEQKKIKQTLQSQTTNIETNTPLKGWSNRDLIQLVSLVENACAECLSSEYSEIREKVDWSKVSFGEHTAVDCEKAWSFLLNKTRAPKKLLQQARKLLIGNRRRVQKFVKKGYQNISTNDGNKLSDEKSNSEGDNDDDGDNNDDDNEEQEEEEEPGTENEDDNEENVEEEEEEETGTENEDNKDSDEIENEGQGDDDSEDALTE